MSKQQSGRDIVPTCNYNQWLSTFECPVSPNSNVWVRLIVCAIEAGYSRYPATHWYTCRGKPVMPSVLICNAPVPRGGQTLAWVHLQPACLTATSSIHSSVWPPGCRYQDCPCWHADWPNQVYLPAIVGHVPPQMVCAISSFMEFCYLVCCNIINKDNILSIDNAVAKFHVEHTIFDDMYLPWWVFTSPSTLTCSLHIPHSRIWGTKWSLFIHNQIKAYKGC